MKPYKMSSLKLCVFLLTIIVSIPIQAQQYALVLHGGAGHQTRERYSPEEDAAYRQSLKNALQTGRHMLAKGIPSVDVVEAVISQLENDSLFNAGRGSVLNINGEVECDASIMNGQNKNAGAIAGVKHLKNPIQTARLVMEESPHVMLSGNGAEKFAQNYDVDFVDNSYFITARRAAGFKAKMMNKKHGTVGAVALDTNGNIAAATSTGGMSDKAFGRIGDSPVIGAGTYADNKTCGVSCTGHGEYFIRYAVAYDMSAIMEYGKMTVSEAAHTIIQTKLKEIGAEGGLIALDAQGNIAMEHNTPGMFRGYVNNSELFVAIYGDE